MNTSNLRKIAPRARVAFITAIKARAAEFGITAKGHAEPVVSGEVLQVAGFTHPASSASALKRLQQRLTNDGYETLIEHMAYTWFNRFCAIRFMELKSEEGYLEHCVRLLSHPDQPQGFEVLDRAPEVIDSLIAEGVSLDKHALLDLLLAGNEQESLFRELLLGQCHRLHQAMPFLFEAIDDETELLLPTGLIRTDAFWRELVDEIPETDWEHVEVIGWLYQFYISDRKEEVIGKVVKPADIPAATQLFTPNWIVQYMVQNSVGRHWLQTYPNSGIKGSLPYYLEPAEQSSEVQELLSKITPASIDPENITVIDPACGSGHILVEAYNVLYRIYQERGYRSRDIPQLILKNNLFGLDIDDRAVQLAGFSLLMRAREDDRRLFTRGITLNIFALQESCHLNIPILWQALNLDSNVAQGKVQDMFAQPIDTVHNDPRLLLLEELHQKFLNAKTFGSLIRISNNQTTPINKLYTDLVEVSQNGDAMQKMASNLLLPLIIQAQVLARRYTVVVANPPYMGSKYYTSSLKEFINSNYKKSKSDLYSAFIEMNYNICAENGYVAMITIPNWMFLSSFEDIRNIINNNLFIDTFVHNGRGVWGSDFGSCAFTLRKSAIKNVNGRYKRLFKKQGSVASNKELIDRFFNYPEYISSPLKFIDIPGSPIAYWINNPVQQAFKNGKSFGEIATPRQGLATGCNEIFLRQWYETVFKNIGFEYSSREDAQESGVRWFPYNKGGEWRKWYGNNEFVVDWQYDGARIRDFKDINGKVRSRPQNTDYYFQEGITWADITTKSFAARFSPRGFIFDVKGSSGFPEAQKLKSVLGLMNCKLMHGFMLILNPTATFQVGDMARVPYIPLKEKAQIIDKNVDALIELSKKDWDSFETSWGFKKSPLRESNYHKSILSKTYKDFRYCWNIKTQEMLQLEEENNRIYIDVYSLQNELSPEVPLNEITLTCNPYYRYGSNKAEEELEAIFQSDTIVELISYAIGCMMGRYSLDREGLIYAHFGNEDFKKLIEEDAYNRFPADGDGILPLTSEAWFEDDIAARVEEFVHTVWGSEHLEENLQFIADSLCLAAIKPVKKGGETSRETIRRYLSTQFFKDHLKTYKKRPIYWLFSSGKEKAFECLVYLHRYNETTLPRMRTEYVTPLLGQMDSRIERLRLQQNEAETAEAKRIGKEIDSLTKQLTELRSFDDQLKHYADMKIQLDLDDGVKVNYGKFGTLLAEVKAITGDKAE
jgi:type II restriction/modification system DNA methylase subunit YeeA